MKPFVRAFRRVLFAPLDGLQYLPGGPARYAWLIRFVVDLDAPLRRYLLGRATDAKSTR